MNWLIPSPRLFVVALLATFIAFFAQWYLPVVGHVVFCIPFLLYFWSRRLFIYYLIFFLVSFDSTFVEESNISGSIYNLTVFGLTVPALIVLTIALGALMIIINRAMRGMALTVPMLVSPFLMILVYGSALGLAVGNDSRQIVHDASYFVAIGGIFFLLKYRFLDDYRDVAKALLLMLVCKFSIAPLNYVFDYGLEIAGDLKVIVDTSNNLSPFVLLFALTAIFGSTRLYGWRMVYVLIALVAALFVFLNAASRGGFLLLPAAIVFSVFVNTISGKVKLNRRFFAATVLVAMTAYFVVSYWPEMESSEGYVYWKLTTMMPTETIGDASTSSTARLFEAINIWVHLRNEGQVFVGTGFGGYFRDDFLPFVHLLRNASAYPESWIDDGTIYKPHAIFLQLLLKVGIIGLTGYLLSLAACLLYPIRLMRTQVMGNSWQFLVFWSSSAFIFFYKNFDTKLQAMFGVYLFVMYAAVSAGRNAHKEYTQLPTRKRDDLQ